MNLSSVRDSPCTGTRIENPYTRSSGSGVGWGGGGGGGGGFQGVRTPLLGHDVGFLTLGPKLDPPCFACRPKMDPPPLSKILDPPLTRDIALIYVFSLFTVKELENDIA